VTDGPPARRPRYPGEGEPGRRLFVAAPLPEPAADAIAALVDRVRSRGVPGGGRDVRWVRLDGLHLTLRFLGPTLDPRVDPAREAVRTAGTGARGFDLVLGTAGAFPEGGRPRTLWVDVLDGAAELGALAARLDEALVAAGWPPETRPFKAHLTLARSDGVPAGRAIAQSLIDEAATLRIEAAIDRIGLFESLTGGGPARYEPVEVVPLA
jgi:RNA 2',3'-cyclic 3'-phosphodiesterase